MASTDQLNEGYFGARPGIQRGESFSSQVSSPGAQSISSGSSTFSFSDPQTSSYLAYLGILPPSDPRSPYHISLPINCQPTEELAKRFTIWKKIIKQIVFYLKEMSVLRQHYYKLNQHMLNNIQFLSKPSGKLRKKRSTSSVTGMNEVDLDQNAGPDLFAGLSEEKFVKSSFLPAGDHSVSSIAGTLYEYHKSLSEKELVTYNQLTLKLIPRLEVLKKSLNLKIKEILNLKSDFKFSKVQREVALTGQVLTNYVTVVDLLHKGCTTNLTNGEKLTIQDCPKLLRQGKYDPYLLRIEVDQQLKKQLLEENYLREAFINLQTTGFELEKIVYKEVQSCMKVYATLVNMELTTVKETMIDPILEGVAKNSPSMDWDFFMSSDAGKNFINLSGEDLIQKNISFRKVSEIQYPYKKTVISRSVRSGFLDKKSKLLKTYHRVHFVLTVNYLHEFKTNDRIKERTPILSLNLNEVSFAGTDNDRKFILHVKGKSAEEHGSKFVIKCADPTELSKWASDLSELTSYKSTIERNLGFEKKFSRTSSFSSLDSSRVSLGERPLSEKTPNDSGFFDPSLSSSSAINISGKGHQSSHSASSFSALTAPRNAIYGGRSPTSPVLGPASPRSPHLSPTTSFLSDPGPKKGSSSTTLNQLNNQHLTEEQLKQVEDVLNLKFSLHHTDTPGSHTPGAHTPPIVVTKPQDHHDDYFGTFEQDPKPSRKPASFSIDGETPVNVSRKKPVNARLTKNRLNDANFKLQLPNQPSISELMNHSVNGVPSTPGELPDSSVRDVISKYRDAQPSPKEV